MNSRHARRSGRQIPEYLLLGALLSLSMARGFPLALYLRLSSPQMNPFLRMFLALTGGFLILIALWLLSVRRRGCWFACGNDWRADNGAENKFRLDRTFAPLCFIQ